MTEQKEKAAPTAAKKETLYLALIALVLIAIAVALIARPRAADAVPAGSIAPEGGGEPETVIREKKTFVEVEKTITTEMLEDGLRDMGVLITEEYYFTEVIDYSSAKKLFKTDITLPFTESSYLASYDGVVSAGIDLSAARVEKDDERKKITLHVPKASIRATDIDLDSLTVYEEKTGLGNPVSVRDFNASMRELEASAERKAKERGILEKADENGRAVITQFIASLVDTSEYALVFTAD